MSKPLATKVSTPLSEDVQIGPKMSICCVATIIFQHCLNPLGHGVHQSFTGCHWMLETLCSSTFRLRMPHRLPLLSASLARQWSSWRCVWDRYHVGIMPWGQVSEGRVSMSQFMLAFMVPSINCSSPVPATLMQPQTMTLPPPWLTARHTCLCTPHLVAATQAWHHLNQISLSWSHQTTGHGSSNPCP